MVQEEKKASILIVEDESIVAMDLRRRLELAGYEILGIALSAEAALESVAKRCPDLIMMDISLGGALDGVNVAQLIKAEYDPAIIFLTAFSDQKTVERVKESHAAAYLLKPFQERELFITIDMVLAKHQAELRLRESRSWLDATLNAISNGVIAVDSENKIQFMNRVAERMFATKSEVSAGRALSSLFTIRESLTLNGLFAARGKRQNADELAWSYLEYNGQSVPVELTRTRLASKGGMVISFRDIRLEKEYESSLLQAKQVAEEASRAKSEFLSNMSHELRTPLNSIIGMIELTRDPSCNGEEQEYLDIARQSADSLLFLINSILDFSKLEANKMSLHREPFDCVESVSDCIEGLSVQAFQKGLSLVYRADPAFPASIVGDKQRFNQILINLLSNAIKFTELGKIRIDLGFETDQSSGHSEVILSVRDTGIGIAADKLATIWDEFTQLDGSSTRSYGGTGLGLAIVKSLSTLMGGNVEVKSTLGSGTIFTVRLPLEKEAGVGCSLCVQDDLKGILLGLAIRDPDERLILTETLETFGCEVLDLGNASGMLQLLNNSSSPLPELLFIDDALADKHCFFSCVEDEACVQKLQGRLVVLSGIGDQNKSIWRSLSDSVRFLIKPPSNKELLSILRRGPQSLAATPSCEETKLPIVPQKKLVPLSIIRPNLESKELRDLVKAFLSEKDQFEGISLSQWEALANHYRQSFQKLGSQPLSRFMFKIMLACRREDTRALDAYNKALEESLQSS
ncbi:hypothetical protein MASR2M78_28930 [Treponema sp.]